MNKMFSTLFILGMATLTLPVTAAAQSVKVAVMPFQIYAEKDYTSLQKGIVEMLTARLAAPNQVTVIDPLATAHAAEQTRGLTGDSLAMAVGAELKADFILHGSMTIFGESISIDARMLNITGTLRPLTVFKQARGMGQVIPQIDLLAKDIVTQAFYRPPAEPVPVPVAAPTASESKKEKQDKLGIHAHPEKLLEELRSGSEEE